MKLVVHAGFHKTGTTYLQAIMARNRKALVKKGILYFVCEKQIASHRIAWSATRGDFAELLSAIEAARAANCHTLLLSSEDFETIILDLPRAREFESAATNGGINSIEWTVTLREPGEYFTSMFSELSRHTFVDPVAMFVGATRDGRFLVTKPVGHPPDYFNLCFDYRAHLLTFARSMQGTVVANDYATPGPFPGFRILRKLNVGTLDTNVPEINRNVRMPAEEMWQRYAARLVQAAKAGYLSEALQNQLADRLVLDQPSLQELGAAISQRFGPGMQQLLARRAPATAPPSTEAS